MRNLQRTAACITLLIFLTFNLSACGSYEERAYRTQNDHITVIQDDHHFRQLTDLQKDIYNNVGDAVSEFRKNVNIKVYNIKNPEQYIKENLKNDFERAVFAFIFDHPELFYVDKEFTYTTGYSPLAKYMSGYVNMPINVNLSLSYVAEKDEAERMKAEMESAEDSFVSDLPAGADPFTKEVLLFDKLVRFAKYDSTGYENKNIPLINHTAYSALVLKTTVCDGFASAFQLLLARAGVESLFITGMGQNDKHAWNLVKLDGEYYHVDVTGGSWEDDEGIVSHSYFNLTDEQISADHKADDFLNMPRCTATKYNYYIKNGLTADSDAELKSIVRANVISKSKNKEQYFELMLDYNSKDPGDCIDSAVNSAVRSCKNKPQEYVLYSSDKYYVIKLIY